MITDRHMYLKFFMVEGFEEVLGDELTESLLKSQKLGFNSTHKPPVHIKSEKHKRKLMYCQLAK